MGIPRTMNSSFFSQQMAPWRPNFPHQRLWSWHPINEFHANSALIFNILTKSHTCVGQLCVDFLPTKIKVGYNKSRLPFFVVKRAISINSSWLCSNLQRRQMKQKLWLIDFYLLLDLHDKSHRIMKQRVRVKNTRILGLALAWVAWVLGSGCLAPTEFSHISCITRRFWGS